MGMPVVPGMNMPYRDFFASEVHNGTGGSGTGASTSGTGGTNAGVLPPPFHPMLPYQPPLPSSYPSQQKPQNRRRGRDGDRQQQQTQQQHGFSGYSQRPLTQPPLTQQTMTLPTQSQSQAQGGTYEHLPHHHNYQHQHPSRYLINPLSQDSSFGDGLTFDSSQSNIPSSQFMGTQEDIYPATQDSWGGASGNNTGDARTGDDYKTQQF